MAAHPATRNSWQIVFACVISAAIAAWFAGSPASGQQPPEPTKLEYNVVTIDANTLAAKLTEFGNQGWDVVMITTSEARVDGTANPPKVITEKYDVTCRKPARK